MKPEIKSQLLLGVTRSKAKMFEYGLPEEYHIRIVQDPVKLFTISIGILGDLAAAINRNDEEPKKLLDFKSNLLFSARFFDSYLQSKLDDSLDTYLILLGSASYYLCDLPGSSIVMAKYVSQSIKNLGEGGLESILLWLLRSNYDLELEIGDCSFTEICNKISKSITQYFNDGSQEELLYKHCSELRSMVYNYGTPRELLFGDIISAIIRRKIDNSSWKALPLYSDQNKESWLTALQKDTFIKELWPAQHLLGEKGNFQGRVCCSTNANKCGKTKAIELVLRSAFIADRISLAIIVAPFRALCHEIKDSLTEAFNDEGVRVVEFQIQCKLISILMNC